MLTVVSVVAKSELDSAKRSVHREQSNTGLFFPSSKEAEMKRVKSELRRLVQEFKSKRVGTSFESEELP